MPEIISAFEASGHYFGIVAVEIEGRVKKFRFGLSYDSYRACKKLFQTRSFGSTPGFPHRYYFAGAFRRHSDKLGCSMWIRIQQGLRGKQVEVYAPKDLLANLTWFFKLKDFNDAAHLPELD